MQRKNLLAVVSVIAALVAAFYFASRETTSSSQAAAGAPAPLRSATGAPGSRIPNAVAAPFSSDRSPGAPAQQSAVAAAMLLSPAERRDANGFEIITWPDGKPHFAEEPVEAFVTVGSTGRKLRMEVNQLGEYPRVGVAPKDTVDVTLQFHRSAPGVPVALAAQDGGRFDGKASRKAVLNESRQTQFSFTASENPGTHRVTIMTPMGEVKTLDFWVGPPNVMRTAVR